MDRSNKNLPSCDMFTLVPIASENAITRRDSVSLWHDRTRLADDYRHGSEKMTKLLVDYFNERQIDKKEGVIK
jgi:hypothetical protein